MNGDIRIKKLLLCGVITMSVVSLLAMDAKKRKAAEVFEAKESSQSETVPSAQPRPGITTIIALEGYILVERPDGTKKVYPRHSGQ